MQAFFSIKIRRIKDAELLYKKAKNIKSTSPPLPSISLTISNMGLGCGVRKHSPKSTQTLVKTVRKGKNLFKHVTNAVTDDREWDKHFFVLKMTGQKWGGGLFSSFEIFTFLRFQHMFPFSRFCTKRQAVKKRIPREKNIHLEIMAKSAKCWGSKRLYILVFTQRKRLMFFRNGLKLSKRFPCRPPLQ